MSLKSSTCECVSSFVGQVLDGINDSVFGGESIKMPLYPGISTVLSQTYTQLHKHIHLLVELHQPHTHIIDDQTALLTNRYE